MTDEPKTPRQKKESAWTVFRLVVGVTAGGMAACLVTDTASGVWAEHVGP